MNKKIKKKLQKNQCKVLSDRFIIDNFSFYMTKHSKKRALERSISTYIIAYSVLKVSHHFKNILEKSNNKAKFIIPDYNTKIAVMLVLNKKKGSVITVLKYPDMTLPSNVPVLSNGSFI